MLWYLLIKIKHSFTLSKPPLWPALRVRLSSVSNWFQPCSAAICGKYVPRYMVPTWGESTGPWNSTSIPWVPTSQSRGSSVFSKLDRRDISILRLSLSSCMAIGGNRLSWTAAVREYCWRVCPSLLEANVPMQPRSMLFFCQVTNKGNSWSSNPTGGSFGVPWLKN